MKRTRYWLRATWVLAGLGAVIMVAVNEDFERVAVVDPGELQRGLHAVKKCQACHAFERKLTRVGPHLVGVVGREVGSVGDFEYSDSMAADKRIWDAEHLLRFLAAPAMVYPDTKMAVAGVTPDEAAGIIAYMKSLEW